MVIVASALPSTRGMDHRAYILCMVDDECTAKKNDTKLGMKTHKTFVEPFELLYESEKSIYKAVKKLYENALSPTSCFEIVKDNRQGGAKVIATKFIPKRNKIETCVETVRDINKDEEITVYYSPYYFGVDNDECKCRRCEKTHFGFFKQKMSLGETDTKSDESEGNESHTQENECLASTSKNLFSNRSNEVKQTTEDINKETENNEYKCLECVKEFKHVSPSTEGTPVFNPGDVVNVLTSECPYLAAIVEENDGECITYFHPYLKVKRCFTIPHRFVRRFEPQCMDGQFKFLKEVNKKKIKAAKKLVKRYEVALYKYLGHQQ
ncbi:hypothetical protein AGLY_003489 [Aphis glycines]|uniref:SET domain-containing protein n=1 Tax=Aphis glycines TaxID=307491 RepID=A0A6G0U249_APHGL|nr:hypothetical protein AGLY_003489 [Aphis glycines]